MMTRKSVISILGVLMVSGLVYVGHSLYVSHYPEQRDPSPNWEPYVQSLNAERHQFFIDSEGVKLEAALFIPNTEELQKPAIVFTGGSGDGPFQNYSSEFIETVLLNPFLARGYAVLLFNKRGIGLSEGNYVKRDIEDRAVDLYAAVRSLRQRPEIDAKRIGVSGHSQGGWVVVEAAARYPDIAFFLSLAGPTMTVWEQGIDMYRHMARCEGLTGEDVERYVEESLKEREIGLRLGEWTNFGMWGWDARNAHHDPRENLREITAPGLFLFGEHDDLVTPALNIQRLEQIFSGNIPPNLSTEVVENGTHSFRLVSNPCDSITEPRQMKPSSQVAELINSWMDRQGL